MDWLFDVSATAVVVIGLAVVGWMGFRRRGARAATADAGDSTYLAARLGPAGGSPRRGRLRVEPGSLIWVGGRGRSVDLTSVHAQWVARAPGWRGERNGEVEVALEMEGDEAMRLVLDVQYAAVVFRRLGHPTRDTDRVEGEAPAGGAPIHGGDAVASLHRLAPQARRHVGARTWDDPRRPGGAAHAWRRDLLSQMAGPATLVAVLAFLAALPDDSSGGGPGSSALPVVWGVVGAIAVVAWSTWLTVRARREVRDRAAALEVGSTPMVAVLTADLGGGPGLVMADARDPSARLLGVPLRQPLPAGTAGLFSDHGLITVLLWGRAEVGEHVVVDVADSGDDRRLYPAGPIAELAPDGILEVTNSPEWLARHG